MALPVVTAIDRKYLPGLQALANSFFLNAGDEAQLYCIVHGGDALWCDVAATGAIPLAPPAWNTKYPTTAKWPDEMPAMYSRLLLPQMFTERVVWIDADCIVLKSLAPLAELEFDEPLAAIRFHTGRYTVEFQVPGYKGPDAGKVGPFSGLMVFNVDEWNRLRLTERCAEIMNSDSGLDFRFVVQSVLALAVKDNFHPISDRWQIFANRKDPIPPDARVLHWVGGLPWREKMNHQSIWERYA